MRTLKRLINRLFLAIGIKILKAKNYSKIIRVNEYAKLSEASGYSSEDAFANVSNQFLELWPVDQLRELSIYARYSRSQLGQDLIALQFNNFKTDGYFVEIGAADGVHFSNTYLLEKKLNWRGLCVEPAKGWHEELLKNRECFVDLRAVGENDGDLVLFKETEIKVLSTFSAYVNNDLHAEARHKGTSYNVETVTLDSLLQEYRFPKQIDYLSVDTEGSEIEILKAFNWANWKFNFISVEHNYTSNREIVRELLEQNGYKRVLTEISDFDDYFVLRDVD